MKKLNKKGFTIVELVIVIAVIGILAAVLIPTFSGVVEKANLSSAQSQAKNDLTTLVALNDGTLPAGSIFFINADDDKDAEYAFGYTNNSLKTLKLASANSAVQTTDTAAVAAGDGVSAANAKKVYRIYVSSSVLNKNGDNYDGFKETDGDYAKALIDAVVGAKVSDGNYATAAKYLMLTKTATISDANVDVTVQIYFSGDLKATDVIFVGTGTNITPSAIDE